MMLHIAMLLLMQAPSLDSSSPKERQAAVEQMAVFGNAAAIAPLTAALKKEPKSDMRVTIVAGLGRIRDKRAVPILAETLTTDLNKDVRLQAIESFERLYIPAEESGPLKTIFNRVKTVIAGTDRSVVRDETVIEPLVKDTLADALRRDSSPDVRGAAAHTLGSLKAGSHVAALITALDNPQNMEYVDVRFEIIQSLGLLRDPAAGPVLKKSLGDPSKPIVMESVTALGLIGFREARADLETLFRQDTSSKFLSVTIDKDRNLRRRALEALALMRDPATKPLFESLLADVDDRNRELAAEGLARLYYSGPAKPSTNGPESLDAANALKARYELERKLNVRVAMAFALTSSGQDNYFPEIANALATGQSYQAEAYLYEIGKYEGKLSLLHPYLRSANPKIRAHMARVLGEIGDPSSKDLIQQLTSDKDNDVLREALAALRRYNAR